LKDFTSTTEEKVLENYYENLTQKNEKVPVIPLNNVIEKGVITMDI